MKRVLLLFSMFLSIGSVFAADNVLQTIEIEPVKDTYNIVLVADKAVDVKKEVKASNKITLSLKDIRASKTLNTVYNNVSNVDTVMVEPQGNGISIFFQAENAASATVSFDAIAPVVAPSSPKEVKKLKLSHPIESYAPIYNEEFDEEKTSNLFKKLTSKTKIDSFSDNLAEESDNSDVLNKIFSFGLVAFLAIAVVRLFKRKEPEMKIGLTQSLNEREIELYGNKQPLGQLYPNVEKPFTSVNYGINAYQKENRNPYETAPMQFHNSKLKSAYKSPLVEAAEKINAVNSAQIQSQGVATAVQQQLANVATKSMTTQPIQNNMNVDNLKFLESMTAIYEKSGRHDLARGLKASLNKGIK